MNDLVIRNGTVVMPEGTIRADVAIEGETISNVGSNLPPASKEIDATGCAILPGMIDVHVHFNEPGHTDWEGAATGSRALAANGGTLFFDMPLNSIPCTVNAREFDKKRAALEASAVTDFALWGGLVPGNVNEMEELAERGVIGFKAFLCHSGLDEFPRVDDLTLFEGLCEAARLDLPIAIHAENHELIAALSQRMLTQGRRTIRDFLESRPVLAEIEAIQRATLLAGEAGAKLHVIHISSGRGVAIAAEARARGVNVSIETCPHYLFFTDEDVERLGAVAKCAPPIRDADEQKNLWAELVKGTVDIIASDHSPSSPERKAGDFWTAWGGIAGVQSTLSVLLDRAHHQHRLPLERIASLIAGKPAQRFNIPNRGRVAAGAVADLALIDPSKRFVLEREHLLQRHPMSPYIGSSFRGIVRQTIRRGETIFVNDKVTVRSGGKLVRPFK